MMWWLCQGAAARAAHCFHATAPHEVSEIRNAGIACPVAVIPNGADLPATWKSRATGSKPVKRLLFLGRIAPVKGVDLLLYSWKAVQRRFPDWELRIVGRNDAGYADVMVSLARELKLERVTITGPAYGSEKVDELLAADLFVLPTHTENFGNAIGEALSYALPVVVTRGAPWPGIETNDCGWWIDRGEQALTECLGVALRTTPDTLHAMGLRGRNWIARDFSWDRIAAMTLELYEWVLGGSAGSPPNFVSTN
jgi:glycosyltransferase involved in cell wall biosynthesis